MWKSMYQIRLIRLEGISDFNSCDLMLNGEFVESLYPSNPGNFITLNSHGIYMILVKQIERELSVSFELKILKDEGMQWLPLQENSENHIISLADEVPLPRVLLLWQVKRIEDICSSIVTEESISESDFMPQISLFSYDVYTPRFHCEDVTPKSEKLLIEGTDTTQYNTEIDTKLNESQETNKQTLLLHISRMKSELDSSHAKSQNALTQLESKNQELIQVYNEIHSLKSKISKFESENIYLQSLNDPILHHQTSALNSQLLSLKDSIKKPSSPSPSPLKTTNTLVLEEMVKKECLFFGISSIIKENEVVYSKNTLKLNILTKNNKLYCREGDNTKAFAHYADKLSSEKTYKERPFTLKSPFRKPLSVVSKSISYLKSLRKTSSRNSINSQTTARSGTGSSRNRLS